MKTLLGVVQMVLAALLLVAFTSAVTHGRPEYSKKEKTACTTCHTKTGSKELNDVGKCYAQKKSLEACQAPPKK